MQRPKLLIDAEKQTDGSLICHVAQFEPLLFTKNVPFLKMLNLTVLNKRKTITTQTDSKQYNQFASSIIPSRPSQPLTFFHWLSDNNNNNNNNNNKSQQQRRRSSMGGKDNYKWWPDSQLNSAILEIYTAKIRANRADRNLGYPFDSMADFILDHFSLCGKQSKAGMRKVQELLVSVQRFNTKTIPKRIFWFGIVTGIIETDMFRFNDCAGDILLEVLELIFPHEDEIISKMNDHQIIYVIRNPDIFFLVKYERISVSSSLFGIR